MKNINFVQAAGILANVGVIAGIALLAVELNQNNHSRWPDFPQLSYLRGRNAGGQAG